MVNFYEFLQNNVYLRKEITHLRNISHEKSSFFDSEFIQNNRTFKKYYPQGKCIYFDN